MGLAVLATVAGTAAAVETDDSAAAALAVGYSRVFLIAAGLGVTMAAVSLSLPQHRPR